MFLLLLEHDRPSQRDLNLHVVPTVTIKWKAVGESLLDPKLVENKALEIIEKDNLHSVEKCCKQMFLKWLDTDNGASWKKLITVLQFTGVDLNYLAKRIEGMLQKGMLPT